MIQSRLTDLPIDNSIDLICPECGYDLRGIDSGRCPECGKPFDRSTAVRSTIPWANRHTIGRVRAYWRTAWLATARARLLADEIKRPVSWRDAQRFRFVTTCIASLAPIALWIIALESYGGTGALFPDVSQASQKRGLSVPPAMDVLLPWSAGLLLWPTIPLAIFLLFLLISGVASYWFAPKSIDVIRQNRSLAVSLYACAPMAWTAIPVVISTALILLGNTGLLPKPWRFSISVLGGVIGIGLLVGIIFIMWMNTLRLLKRCADASGLRMMVCAVGLPVSWLLCAWISFGVMPWVVGFVFLVIDSLWR